MYVKFCTRHTVWPKLCDTGYCLGLHTAEVMLVLSLANDVAVDVLQYYTESRKMRDAQMGTNEEATDLAAAQLKSVPVQTVSDGPAAAAVTPAHQTA